MKQVTPNENILLDASAEEIQEFLFQLMFCLKDLTVPLSRLYSCHMKSEVQLRTYKELGEALDAVMRLERSFAQSMSLGIHLGYLADFIESRQTLR